jgi:hypothetical protein
VLAQSGARPIIQIDAHGNQQNGLKIAASGEFISWPDLNRALQTINRETKNNLCVVSAVCYGLSIIHSLKLTMPSPFLVMIAPEKEVSFGAIEDTLCDFYQDIFSGSDLSLSFGKHLKSYMTLIHSEKVLAMCMARYVRNYCTGVGGEKRREKLLTDALESGIPNNRHNRRAVRKSVKSQIKPDQRLLDRYVDSFLLGKAVSYTMVDLIKLARPGN